MSSQADQEAIPVEADSAPTSVAKLEASAETDITTSAVPIDPVLTTEQPPPLAHRLGTLKASQKADGRHQFPFTHQESQPKPPSTPHLNRNPPTQASIIMSDSPSRLFDTAIDESDGTSTGSLDIGSFNSFLGSAIASTPRNRKKSTNMLDAGTPHQATTLSPKKRPSSSQEDGAPAPKRHRQDAGGDGPREETTPAHAPPLHITLESLAESWHRLDKDWLDDRIVNLFISRLATASVGTVDSLILSSPTQNSRTGSQAARKVVTGFLQWLYEDEKLYVTVETKPCPAQDNTDDCGVFTVIFADLLARTNYVPLDRFPNISLCRKILQRTLLSSPHSMPPVGRLATLSDTAVLPDLVNNPFKQAVTLQKSIWDWSVKLSALLSHLHPSQTRQVLQSNRCQANATAALMGLEKLHRMHLSCLGKVLADAPYTDALARLSTLRSELDSIKASLTTAKSKDPFGISHPAHEFDDVMDSF
ncbi:hypothetical protein CSUB01_10009 [Colletotrichum sublineola]|uniref:Ulp1 protease family protein n=1 Tax=Colletotrichum sublineola TaxID=1173701 RepID=A0A066XDX3_COLSU|nr:hypothetical protein CSUB01_10009 [Colletotrichum sublineola]